MRSCSALYETFSLAHKPSSAEKVKGSVRFDKTKKKKGKEREKGNGREKKYVDRVTEMGACQKIKKIKIKKEKRKFSLTSSKKAQCERINLYFYCKY